MRNYFASEPAEDLVKECESFARTWYNVIGTGTQGISAVWFRNLRYYYNNVIMGSGYDSSLEFTGEEGEIVKMLVPQARSLNQQFLSICTKQKLNFEPLADSTDSGTLNATRLCAGLIQQILRDQKLDMKGYRMAEIVTLMGMGYLYPCWNMMKGKPVGTDHNGDVIYSGNLDIQMVMPTDVVFDHTKEDFYDLDWVIIRTVENKWDLVRKYPRLQDEILRLPTLNKAPDNMMFFYQQFNEDYINLNYFIHKSTPAMPDGRFTVYGDSKVITYDDVNPYKNDDGAYIPLVQMKPEPLVGTGWGYPMFSNIMPLQEMLDHSFSAIASNQAANAVQCILNPNGNDLSVKNIGGNKFMNYTPKNIPGGNKPEALQLTATAPETYKFADMILNSMQQIYNVNSAMRGAPPPGVTSGTAIATLTTNGVEFAQNFIKCYIDTIESCVTMCFDAYKNFAEAPMLVNLVGPNRTTMVKDFVGTDLKTIKRIIAKVSNPLMSTAAGRFEVANQLLQQQRIPDARTYFEVLEGAPLSIMYDEVESEDALIQRENDDMRNGVPVHALFFDGHDEHINHHKTLTYDTEIRRNGQILQSVLNHIDEHNSLKMQASGAMPNAAAPPGGAPGPMPPHGGPQMGPPGPPPQSPHPSQPAGSLPHPTSGGPGGPMPPPANPAKPPIDIGKIPMQGPSGMTGV